jgi:MFS family permease
MPAINRREVVVGIGFSKIWGFVKQAIQKRIELPIPMSAAGARPGIFSDANYRAYLAGFWSAEVSAQVQYVAIGWQVFILTHNPLDLGLVGLMMWLPAILFMLGSGMLADRFNRRNIVVAGRFGEAACAAAFIVMIATHVSAPWAYLAMVFVLGTARALPSPAQRTLLANIVPPNRYANAQAAYVSGREFLGMASPALGGILIAAFSTIAAFGLGCAASLIAALALSTLRVPQAERSAEPQTWRTFLAGISFLRVQPIIAGAITLDLFAVLFGGASALFPIFADTILHAGPVGLGLLRSAMPVGAACVAAFLAHRPPRRHVGPMLLAVVAAYGFSMILFGVSKALWLSLAALAAAGAFDVVSVVIRSALVQLNTPDEMRGRVSAIESVFVISSGQLGGFESGAVAALIGTVPSVIFGGCATLVMVAASALLFPALRNADTLQSVRET